MLLIGILKGQALIDSRKAQLLGDDFRNISLYLHEYQGKFKALPGDDPTIGTANTHLAGAVSCAPAAAGKCMTGNGIIDGYWNDTTTASESFVFWQHVRLANLMTGDTDISSTNYLAKNAVGGSLGITNQNATPIVGLKGAQLICSDHIVGKFAKQIDLALDDGNTATGSVMVTVAGTVTGGGLIARDSIVDSNFYLVCMGI
ncbi:MAG TPA: prepilin-type cleavage/methylation domain-containing protein [Gallionella sp.]|nr:prepilin-type cleavage/methylation domain-containing protein [Gallionella sp.]